MTRHFCTYFDKNYLVRGLALYESLTKHCPDFILWILSFDDESYRLLEKIALPNVRLIRLSDFEDEKLLAAKTNRKFYEYYWTTTPSLPLYVLRLDPTISQISYLDADLYFYSSPEPIFTEMENASIMIIPHNYSQRHSHRIKTSGIYNVGMLTFRNDANSLRALEWWRDRCNEWCFDRYEDGKFGDQLYLDDWTERFDGVHILRHQGANVASWNIENWSPKEWPLIFYHFHGLKAYMSKNHVRFYPVQILDKKIYNTYRNALEQAYGKVLSINPKWVYGLALKLGILKSIKQRIHRLFFTVRRLFY